MNKISGNGRSELSSAQKSSVAERKWDLEVAGPANCALNISVSNNQDSCCLPGTLNSQAGSCPWLCLILISPVKQGGGAGMIHLPSGMWKSQLGETVIHWHTITQSVICKVWILTPNSYLSMVMGNLAHRNFNNSKAISKFHCLPELWLMFLVTFFFQELVHKVDLLRSLSLFLLPSVELQSRRESGHF